MVLFFLRGWGIGLCQFSGLHVLEALAEFIVIKGRGEGVMHLLKRNSSFINVEWPSEEKLKTYYKGKQANKKIQRRVDIKGGGECPKKFDRIS